ncbi:MAG: response regulator [Deltaproteobacteria bacterium]|nr:response regulator [Deltaproteobacteria bacterium]
MGKRILVVDDEPDTVTFFTEVLQEHGYETSSATNGAEALESVRAQRPDLVTLDITMPEQSGIRAFRELREDESLKDIPVLMLTGVAPDFKKFISSRRNLAAPDGYIEKPVRPEALLREVRRLIG